MELAEAKSALTPTHLLESVTRTLRHEVGDLLQTIYSTVAILQERVPQDAKLERRFLSDLRSRAETCKDELDAVHDLVLPVTLKFSHVDLAELAEGLVASANVRYKSLTVEIERSVPLPIEADAQRLNQIGRLLLAGACQSAQHHVLVRTSSGPDPDEVEWSIEDDGHGATPEQLRWLTTPFATTQQALSGLGLALARRIVELHGGRITVANQPGGGFRVSMVLPRRR